MEGHTISQCKATLNPAAKPFSQGQANNTPAPAPVDTIPAPPPLAKSTLPKATPMQSNTSTPPGHTHKGNPRPEPAFDELLQGTAPITRPLPDDRPEKIRCFLDRDDEFFEEVEKLSRAVVLYGEVELRTAVRVAVDTGLVREEEIRVAQLARKRILIHLPVGLKVDTFIKAIPAALWEQGLSIQPWTQLEGAKVTIPRFKLLLDLIDFPVHVLRDKEIIKAVSSFGIFLGTVAPEHKSNLSFARVAIATDDLRRVPKALEVLAGGLEYPVEVRPVTWETGPIYTAADFPTQPDIYSAPNPPSPPQGTEEMDTSSDESFQEGDDRIYCSRRAILELCSSLELEAIPPELRDLIIGRKNSDAVPIKVLRELVEHRPLKPSTFRDKSNLGDAGQNTQATTHTTQMATRRNHTEPITPNLAEFFNEDQAGERCLATCCVETNPSMQKSDVVAVHSEGSLHNDRLSNKSRAVLERGQGSAVTTAQQNFAK